MANLARAVLAVAFGASLSACGAGAIAPPPPQVQVQPQPVAVQPSAPITLDRFRACLALEDMTKERLDCYDAIVPPEPKDGYARWLVADTRVAKVCRT